MQSRVQLDQLKTQTAALLDGYNQKVSSCQQQEFALHRALRAKDQAVIEQLQTQIRLLKAEITVADAQILPQITANKAQIKLLEKALNNQDIDFKKPYPFFSPKPRQQTTANSAISPPPSPVSR